MGTNYINMMEQSMMVNLTLDDDTEQKCLALCRFDVDEQTFIALLPFSAEGVQNEDGDVYLYEFSEENGQPVLGSITSDEVYEKVSDVFDEWLDQMADEDK